MFCNNKSCSTLHNGSWLLEIEGDLGEGGMKVENMKDKTKD